MATPHTAGPWDAAAQHGGPPSALLGRAMQHCRPRPDMIGNGLDAQTTVSPGAGLATSVLPDLGGQVGVVTQSLFIASR